MQIEDISSFVDTSTEPLAPLYGRADHAPRGPVVLTSADRAALALRALYLLLVFAPFMFVGVPLLLAAHYIFGGSLFLRNTAYRLLLFACRASGAAFIKWGQWASSRPDMLPEVHALTRARAVTLLSSLAVAVLILPPSSPAKFSPLGLGRHLQMTPCYLQSVTDAHLTYAHLLTHTT